MNIIEPQKISGGERSGSYRINLIYSGSSLDVFELRSDFLLKLEKCVHDLIEIQLFSIICTDGWIFE